MNKGWVYREEVKGADGGQTVLDYYTNKYRHSNGSQWQTRIESGQILLNNCGTTAETILQRGDRLTYHRSPWVEPRVPLKFEILYEDRDLLVINKPSGLPVIPGGGFLEHTLLWQLKTIYPEDTPTPIHRLGRGTSGLLLLGRSQLAKSSLAKQMRHRTTGQDTSQLSKVYRTLVPGNSISDRLTIEQPIGKIFHPVLGYIYGATPNGKYARSEIRVIQRYDNHTLIEVTIFTGRPHQIRIHTAAVGYPLLGDPLYIPGGTFAPIDSTQDRDTIPVPGDCGYYLHAYRLSFIHPRCETILLSADASQGRNISFEIGVDLSQQIMNFECPTPKNWTIEV